MKQYSIFPIVLLLLQGVTLTETSANDTAFEELATLTEWENTSSQHTPIEFSEQKEILPTPAARQPRPTLSQILDSQADGADKMFSMEEVFGMIREDYGDEPTPEDQAQISRALTLLQTTKAGTEMCKAVAYTCSMESLEKAGIKIRVKAIPLSNAQYASGISIAPIRYAGRTFLGLGKSAVLTASSTHLLALTLLHEMSHIEDLRRNQTNGTLQKAAYASEEKALMNEIAGYDEIVRKYPGFSSDYYEFLVEVWAWKNEGAAYPRDRYLYLPVGPKGEYLSVTAHNLLKYYMPGLSFFDSIQKLVRTLWHSSYKDPKEDKKLIEAIRRSAWNRSVVYKNWRKDPYGQSVTPLPQPPVSPTPAPKPPYAPNNDNEGNDNGNGGYTPGSPGEFNPGPYNPHFGNGI